MKQRKARTIRTKRHSVFELIGEGFKNWFTNPRIMLPFLFQSIASMLLFLIGFTVLFKIIGISWLDYSSNNSSSITQGITNLFHSPLSVFFFVLVSLVFYAVYLMISAYFNGGILGMIKEFLRTKSKNGLKMMDYCGKRYFKRLFQYSLFINLAFIVIGIIFFIPIVLSKANVWFILLFGLIVLAIIVLMLFLTFSTFILVFEKKGIFQSISESFKITSKNFFPLLGLVILFGLIGSLVSFIPIFGSIIQLLAVTPAMMFALFQFYLERA